MEWGWSGDEDRWYVDGVGMGTVDAGTGTRFMWGGDGDQIPSPCHSLLQTSATKHLGNMPIFYTGNVAE